ncbi:MAG: ribonuclease R [Alphaproteobacteria bacterium]|nr:MAG: ribonuclease R [Alphaproteobacteria bacterium]
MSRINTEQLFDYLKGIQTPMSKRDLAKAFGLKGDARIELKDAIRDLMEAGSIKKNSRKEYHLADKQDIPAIAVFEVIEINDDGDVLALPTDDTALKSQITDPIIIEIRGKKSCAAGDRILVKLKTRGDDEVVTGLLMRVLGEVKRRNILGRALKTAKAWMIEPVNKSDRNTYRLIDAPAELVDGHLVEVTLDQEAGRGSLKKETATLKTIIGHDDDPKAISIIAMFEKGLNPEFPEDVIAETEEMTVPALGKREDIRDIPLVTIDGADARDFDDAVFAEQTENGGFHIIVAIADVAHYVREGTALAREGKHRGNSTYFPDRVVPMLPERLSNDLCSLRPKETRACMGFHLWIDERGELQKYRVFRGLMKSHARLTYEQAQAAFDGVTDDVTDVLIDDVLKPMHAAFEILEKARKKRGALDIEMPERQIMIDDEGIMTGVTLRTRLNAHKMIEEFMILANVAAAMALEAKSAPCIYRVHDQPDSERIDSASQFLEGFGLNLARGNVPKPSVLNSILHKAKDMDHAHLVNEIILRSQSQAVYSPDNNGHYGLALTKYAHFTSPIRRYADLIVHRSLIRAYGLGEGGLSKEEEVTIAEIADHISKTERNSMEAERSAVDRFTASYLETRISAQFSGRISGVTKFGLFVRLDENGADGLVPIRSLPDDYYIHDENARALIGRRRKRVFRLCAPVTVRVKEADRLTGSTILELVNANNGAEIPGFIGKEPSRHTEHKPYPRGKKGGQKFNKKKKKTTTPKHKRKK